MNTFFYPCSIDACSDSMFPHYDISFYCVIEINAYQVYIYVLLTSYTDLPFLYSKLCDDYYNFYVNFLYYAYNYSCFILPIFCYYHLIEFSYDENFCSFVFVNSDLKIETSFMMLKVNY